MCDVGSHQCCEQEKHLKFVVKITHIICNLYFKATREGDWDLHLSTMRTMLTWFFACDRVNYSRYGTAYWLEMTKLKETNPGSNTSSLYCSCHSCHLFLLICNVKC